MYLHKAVQDPHFNIFIKCYTSDNFHVMNPCKEKRKKKKENYAKRIENRWCMSVN